MKERIADLIQLEIDGAISAEELVELDAASSGDPLVREERGVQRALGRDLDHLAWREPAPGIRENVLREIGRLEPHRRRWTWARWKPERRQAIAFAAGIALILVLNQFLPVGPSIDPARVSGTLIAPPGRVDPTRIDRGPTWVEAWTERSGDRLFLRARGGGDATTPVRIDWEDQDWSIVSVHGDPPGKLGVASGRAHFVPAEPGPFTLELEFQLPESPEPVGDVRLLLGSGNPGDPSATLSASP